MTTIFQKLHNICIVVHDIDRAQRAYEAMGIGPWVAYPPLTEYVELDVPDRAGFMGLQYRVCDLPGVQLQLCQPGQAQARSATISTRRAKACSTSASRCRMPTPRRPWRGCRS